MFFACELSEKIEPQFKFTPNDELILVFILYFL